MNNITFTSLKIKPIKDIKTITFNDKEIEVRRNLSTQDIYDLITITLQKSEDDGYYNQVLLNTYFYLNLIYLCTNITFTDKQREDELKLYDMLRDSGLLDMIIEAFGEDSFNELMKLTQEQIDNNIKYQNSAGAVLRKFVTDLPKNAQAAADIVNSFDKEKYQNVIAFANAAGAHIAQDNTTPPRV